MTIDRLSFPAGNDKLSARVYIPDGRPPYPTVLYLHGAGKSSKDRHHLWQEYLAQAGYLTFAFDHRGCGESTGVFAQCTLNDRLTDAREALKMLITHYPVDTQRLAVIGSSMGGHTASRLTEKFPVSVLILQSAAAYTPNAENIPFDTTFTQILRAPTSWESSAAFHALRSFDGKILVVYGSSDQVIPKEIQKTYASFARQNGLLHTIPDAGHVMLSPDTEAGERVLQELFVTSHAFLNRFL